MVMKGGDHDLFESRLDMARTFRPLRIGVLTISDTRDQESDTSGALLCKLIKRDGHLVSARAWVRDEIDAIQTQVRDWVRHNTAQIIISTGGTGLTGRDVTPEALRPLFDKEIEGFSTVWHWVSYASVGLSTLQSRACAGLVGTVFVFCLPGSNGACRDGWDKIIRWQLDHRYRPCNLAELSPRLLEDRT